MMRAELSLPEDLVQVLLEPVTKRATRRWMRMADLVVVTGSRDVRRAYSSGNAGHRGRRGHVLVIIDASADSPTPPARSAPQDLSTSCSSENRRRHPRRGSRGCAEAAGGFMCAA